MRSRTSFLNFRFLFIPVFFSGWFAAVPAFSTVLLTSGFYGNQAVVNSAATSIALDNDNKQVSFSFLQRTTDQITAFWVHGTPVGACPQYSTILTNDDGADLPVTTSNLGGSDPTNMLPGWTKLIISGSAIGVAANNVYDVEFVSQGGADSADYFSLDAYTEPFDNWIPFDQFNDGDLDTSYNPGTGFGFGLVDAQPVFAVEETSADYGNPYATVNLTSVAGTTLVGEVFSGPGTWVSQVGAYFEKTGTPAGVLTYQLADLSKSTTIVTGTFSTSTAGSKGLVKKAKTPSRAASA